jgi:hypothetical protein
MLNDEWPARFVLFVSVVVCSTVCIVICARE